MKVAVTGASGFIGGHVLQALSTRSCDILAVTRDASRLANWRDQIQIIEMDMGQASAAHCRRLAEVDVLIHLAWDGLPNYKALRHFESELPRQYAFLKSLVAHGLPAMLVAGTCFEYGMQSGGLSERQETRPTNPYGFAKDALRQQLGYLQREHAFALTWAHLFYTYGEDQAPTSIYPQLRAAAARGETRFPMSGGEQLRDYLPVEAVASLLVDLALLRANAGRVNVCAGQPISMRQQVDNWIRSYALPITPELGRYPYPDYEPMAFWGERDKLDALLEPHQVKEA